MFLETSEFPWLAEAGLHGLCASLNTPVVNLDGLPVAPARAAIVVHADDQGGLKLTVGLRSLENGRVKIFAFQGDLDPMAPAVETMAWALSFAEGMGFLFDEDMVSTGGSGGRVRALRHWQELVDDGSLAEDEEAAEEAAAPSALARANEPGLLLEAEAELIDGDEELLLDEVAADKVQELSVGDLTSPDAGVDLSLADEMAEGVDLDLEELADDAPGEEFVLDGDSFDDGMEDDFAAAFEEEVEEEKPEVAPPVEEAGSAEVPLSRFRRASASPDGRREAKVQLRAKKRPAGAKPAAKPAAAAKKKSGASALGRIPIKKVRRGGDGAERPNLLSRLLSSF